MQECSFYAFYLRPRNEIQFLRGGGLVNFHTITLWLQNEVTRKLRNYTKNENK